MITYKSAGVDVSRIKKSQSAIGRIISSTHSGMVKSGFGHYAGLVGIHGGKYLATHTDGVGTKVIIANLLKKYDTVGIDCVAMNVNDIICIGATPISFVDYIAANKNNESVFVDIAKGLAVGAKKSDMPIVGGETAIMPDLFEEKKFAFDLAGMVAGIVDKNKVIMGNKIKPGDIIIGLASTGIHSNGYSLARKVLLKKYSINDTVKGLGKIGLAMLTPTEIYVKPVLDVISKCQVHGLANITGGAFTKLLRLKRTGFVLDMMPEPPKIMQLIENLGVTTEEMYKTFNMGVGFCIVTPKSEVNKVMSICTKHKLVSYEIGHVSDKTGVFLNNKRLA
ncbi:MAG: phosphoribosylformylglycinamidine cyclo-ligase [Nitrososphaeria archaeon]|nr:phosphoribosylformylglycinamidine cyclo-ligase [Nitrososphaeria archaeon]NDB89991.1 phosphoribosylformylglycinamidine cyclo-ligase [Nitrososphaerota archaeon]NDF34258.1 phosphoribosylformylglycinamidine cyclo-ligase [Nitrosopumilaceae archaeon]NDB46797.1 phosphoribosylformylglycinamidine cyclo-ligase [Nitrososphaeria archaeon]NDB92184.1 phosphoribosylformylglycinamidine cyclo-ligase [Nitrososphaeria archaeon]